MLSRSEIAAMIRAGGKIASSGCAVMSFRTLISILQKIAKLCADENGAFRAVVAYCKCDNRICEKDRSRASVSNGGKCPKFLAKLTAKKPHGVARVGCFYQLGTDATFSGRRLSVDPAWVGARFRDELSGGQWIFRPLSEWDSGMILTAWWRGCL